MDMETERRMSLVCYQYIASVIYIYTLYSARILNHFCHKKHNVTTLIYHTIVINLIPSGFLACYGDTFEVAYVSLL